VTAHVRTAQTSSGAVAVGYRPKATRTSAKLMLDWYLDDRGVPVAWPWSFTRFRKVMAHPAFANYKLV
jgi:hypothetical protein